jgi:hypothetical protein
VLALFDMGIRVKCWKKAEEVRYILAGLLLVRGGTASGDGAS